MRKIIALILFAFMNAHGNVHKIELSNNIDVYLYEDFSSDIVKIGVLYDVGSVDAINNSVQDIAPYYLIDKKTRNALHKLGILYGVTVNLDYSELSVHVNPRYVKDFFQLFRANKFEIRDFQYTKDVQILQQKFDLIQPTDIHNNIIMGSLSKESASLISSSKEIARLTQADVQNFLTRYQSCHLSIIVCGSIGYKSLWKVLRSTLCKMPARNQKKSRSIEFSKMKQISITHKFVQPGLLFMYQEDKNNKLHAACLSIFEFLLKKYLYGICRDVTYIDFAHKIIGGESFIIAKLSPMSDVALNNLLKNYYATIQYCSRIKSINLLDAAEYHDLFMKDSFDSIYNVYSLIKRAILTHQEFANIIATVDDVKSVTVEQLQSFLKKILQENCCLSLLLKHRIAK